MNRRSTVIIVCSAVTVAAAAVAIALAVSLPGDATLEFKVRDAVSGKWVWDLTAVLQDREIRGFYQSDAAPAWFHFSHLAPGTATLSLAAPAYLPVSIPVTLRRGANRIDTVIDMTGTEIPDLESVVLFEDLEGSDIIVQLRPVGKDGNAVINHPCLDLRISCRVSVQLKDGIPVRDETESGSTRGEELFRGPLPWTWDAAPETSFRYGARIPGAQIGEHPSLYRAIDYIVVAPNPAAITRQELDDLVQRCTEVPDPESATRLLDAEKGRVRYYLFTSWNVKARKE